MLPGINRFDMMKLAALTLKYYSSKFIKNNEYESEDGQFPIRLDIKSIFGVAYRPALKIWQMIIVLMWENVSLNYMGRYMLMAWWQMTDIRLIILTRGTILPGYIQQKK